MSDFIVKRNSWHYRVNKIINNNNEWYLQRWVDNASFCEYFWVTAFKILLLAFVWGMIAFMLGMLLWAIWMFPFKAAKIIGVCVLVFAAIITLFFAIYWTLNELPKKLKGQPSDKEPGFFAMKYRSWKDRYCPRMRMEK